MKTNLHLLGGSGRIGSAIYESIINFPEEYLNNVWIYCNGNTANQYNSTKISQNPKIKFVNYSAFGSQFSIINDSIEKKDKNIILNLRGVNDKKSWLNKPIESLDLQIKSCKSIIDSEIWMYPNSEIIHFSSQLCNLVEDNYSFDEVCEGEDNYRRSYIISRLHQESLLTAYAFKYGIDTKFLRLPFVYGFDTDMNNPWVLNSLVMQYINNGRIELRKPESFAWFIHKDYLIKYLINLISNLTPYQMTSQTVSYPKCPMIGIQVKFLSKFIIKCINDKNVNLNSELENNLKLVEINNKKDLEEQINHLTSSIISIYKYAKH